MKLWAIPLFGFLLVAPQWPAMASATATPEPAASAPAATAATSLPAEKPLPASLDPKSMAVDKDGNIYTVDYNKSLVYKMTPQGRMSVLAGIVGRPGSTDGALKDATFSGPNGVAVDQAGNIYVAEYNNHTVRKISPNGLVTTLAGQAGSPGHADGKGADARFIFLTAVTTDAAGNLYVTDNGDYTIRKITPEGVVTTLAGNAGLSGSVDGTGSEVRFGRPRGVTVDKAGTVYVADEEYSTIRKIASNGLVTTLAGNPSLAVGSKDATGIEATLNEPREIALDDKGNVYVADTENNIIRKITPSGSVSTFAGKAGQAGLVDGKGEAARFNGPRGVAVGKDGNIYVSDSVNGAIRKITPDGMVTTLGVYMTSGRRP